MFLSRKRLPIIGEVRKVMWTGGSSLWKPAGLTLQSSGSRVSGHHDMCGAQWMYEECVPREDASTDLPIVHFAGVSLLTCTDMEITKRVLGLRVIEEHLCGEWPGSILKLGGSQAQPWALDAWVCCAGELADLGRGSAGGFIGLTGTSEVW